MKSQKGMGLVVLVLMVIVLILLTGVATYVVVSSDIFSKDNETVNIKNTNEISSSIAK